MVLSAHCAQLLSCVQLFATLWTVAARLLCPWDFPSKNTGVGCHFLLQGLPDPGIISTSPAASALAGRFLTTQPPGNPFNFLLSLPNLVIYNPHLDNIQELTRSSFFPCGTKKAI